MKFLAALALFAAVGVNAQKARSSSAPAASPSDDCEAENIVLACLESENPKANSCQGQDWGCLCDAHKDILTCYNNCPRDAGRSAAQAQVDSYCNAASLTVKPTKTRTTSSSTSTSTPSSTSTTSSSSASTTSSSSSARSSSSSSASSTSKSSSSSASSSSASGSSTATSSSSDQSSATQTGRQVTSRTAGVPATRTSSSITTSPAGNGGVGLTANGVLAAVGVVAALL